MAKRINTMDCELHTGTCTLKARLATSPHSTCRVVAKPFRQSSAFLFVSCLFGTLEFEPRTVGMTLECVSTALNPQPHAGNV